MFRKAQNLSAFSQINSYSAYDHKLPVLNSPVKSKFTWYPLIQMCCSKTLNSSVNHIR